MYVVEAQNEKNEKNYMMILLNRKNKDDFIEPFDDLTDFKQN